MVRQLGFLCLIAVATSSAVALAQEVPPTECDRYAAEADDPERQAAGVSDEDLNAALAVPACEGAVEQYAGNRRLVFQLGRAYLKNANLSGAVVRFHQAAEQGHVLAQTYLGALYLEGTGVTRDDAQALLWFGKSAEQGDAVAQYNLAIMQETGRGTAKDEAQAARWYRKSADQGFALAQASLGRMYASGRGVTKDDAQAVAWFRKAAEQDDASGQYRLAGMYADGRGIAKDVGQANLWYRKAADQNYQDADRKAAELEGAESASPAAAEAPAAAPRAGWLGLDRGGGKSRWLLPIVLGAIAIVLILGLLALLMRGKGKQRNVARQLESLKLESLKPEPRRVPDVDAKPAPSSALSALASQIEAIPAPASEEAAKQDADKQDGDKAAAEQDAREPVSDEIAAERADSKDVMDATAAAGAAEAGDSKGPQAQFVAEAIDDPAAPAAMKRCSQCQNEIPPNDYFCCHCGALAIRFSDCQHDVRDNARFCPRCGAILRWSTPKPATVAGALPQAETG